jgi:hypothetical protein
LAASSTAPYAGFPSSTTQALVEGAPSLRSRISWGAVAAGIVTALAVSAMLSLLGTGIAGSAVDATARATPSAASFGIGAGLWLLASSLIGLAAGGYVAARLSGIADGTDGTLHGVAMWGACAALSLVLVGNAVGGIASSTASGAASVIGGLGRGAGSLASAAGQEASGRIDTGTLQSMAQALVQRAQSALDTGGSPDRMTSDQRRAEAGMLITRRVTDGQLSGPDRDRLAQLIAAEYGISAEDAQARVQQVEQQIQAGLRQAEETARRAADAAARGASLAAYFAFGTLLLGAGAAVLGARLGTRALLGVSAARR